MRVPRPGRRRAAPPADIVAAIAPSGGERLLAWASDAHGGTAVAGLYRLHLVRRSDDGTLDDVLDRPWHLVDAGSWTGEDTTLRVTWVDGHPPTRLVLPEPGRFPETLRERVQASVVLGETLDLGAKRSARVVVRRVPATGELVSQAVLGAGVRADDPGVREQVGEGLARVREQVGLD